MSKLKGKVVDRDRSLGATSARRLQSTWPPRVPPSSSTTRRARPTRIAWSARSMRDGGQAVAARGQSRKARRRHAPVRGGEARVRAGWTFSSTTPGCTRVLAAGRRHRGALDKQFDLNKQGSLLASKRRLPSSRARAAASTSAWASTSTPPNASVCSATKAAVDAVTRLARQGAGGRATSGQRDQPGAWDTEGVRAAGIDERDFRKEIEARTPLGRIGQPRDIAPAARCSSRRTTAMITGETLLVGGGLHRRRTTRTSALSARYARFARSSAGERRRRPARASMASGTSGRQAATAPPAATRPRRAGAGRCAPRG